jgi:transcriptional regulator with XRE-family HTH domain
MMMSETRYSNFIRSAEESNEYWTETAISDFTEELCRLMNEKGVSRSELALRIDHSQAYITKVLRGNVNFTLATMTKLARALDAVVRIHLAPQRVVVEWNDRITEQTLAVQYLPEQTGDAGRVVRINSCSTAALDVDTYDTAVGQS